MLSLVYNIIFIIFFLRQTQCLNLKYSCSKVISYHIASISPDCHKNPNVLSNVFDICKTEGYQLETFNITTDDGYILNIFRITSESVNITKPPVFIQHGVAINSGSWISNNNQSLAFNLVNSGYDVYLGNTRGSLYSIKHINMTANNPSYWNFNLDTLSKNDIRLQVTFVANKTGQKISYVGHSMGTTLVLMYASEFSEEAVETLDAIVALAPVVYLDDTIVEILAPIAVPLIDILSFIKVKSLLYPEDVVHKFLVTLCTILPQTCYTVLSFISGITIQFPPEDLLVFLSYWGSGTSTEVLKHYLQISQSSQFRKYDYGSTTNQQKYGTVTPPTYTLSDIQVPVTLLYGKHDILFNQKNVERLYNEVGSVNKSMSPIPIDGDDLYSYSHLDFLDSIHLNEYLNDIVIKILSHSVK